MVCSYWPSGRDGNLDGGRRCADGVFYCHAAAKRKGTAHASNTPSGAKSLTARAQTAGIEALKLLPKLGDFNEDLRDLGVDDLRAVLRVQLAPDDVPPYRIPKQLVSAFLTTAAFS